jgi:asparagine synthase (glutamine-hydrolysing)
MCGIAGLLGQFGPDHSPIATMIQTIAHRGPNGIRTEQGPGWSLAHARLSIIDLEGGWQPLHLGQAVVIGNGEVYNYKELTRDHGLAKRLVTGSDFEPLLHLYASEGERAFDRLRGMYALCLIAQDQSAWLVRDPFGIKPLYWTQSDQGLVFASEPRALLIGTRPQIVPERIEELLCLNYTLTEGSVYAGIQRLAPGAIRQVVQGQMVRSIHRPALPPKPAVFPTGEAELLLALDRVLQDSVSVHQRSDVPYGLFLSGGIDSAAIATMMSRLNARPVTAFTCGFTPPGGEDWGARDERGQAERVARALNLDWHAVAFDEADFWRILPKVAWAMDDPTCDYASLPTYRLAEAAKSDLTVVLTGEGGDELFGGYGRYRRALRPGWLGGRPAEPQVLAPFLKDGGKGALGRWRLAARPPRGLTRLQAAQYGDIATWLPNDLLLKLDRCLMAHGLEGRTPFLDPAVAAFGFHLPDRMKVRGRMGKWLLRQWLAQHCPAAEPFAKKKGFTVPVAAWIAPRSADLGPRIAASPGIAAVCDVDAVRAVFSDERHAPSRWPLLFYALWYAIHIEGAGPDAALQALLA